MNAYTLHTYFGIYFYPSVSSDSRTAELPLPRVSRQNKNTDSFRQRQGRTFETQKIQEVIKPERQTAILTIV